MNRVPAKIGQRKLYTTAEVAVMLEIQPPALRAHIHTGTLKRPSMKVGQSYLWTYIELLTAMQALNVPGRRKPRRPADARMRALNVSGRRKPRRTADANDLGDNSN